ncbi:MAG: nicotinate-nucleotide adenylyltransferase [Cyanobium sp.]
MPPSPDLTPRPVGEASQGPIALFGSSADPPTHGHRALLEGLLALYPCVITWASDNPLKQHTAPLELRLALLQAVVEAIADPRLSLVQDLSSPWAMETLERARGLWPGREPVFVVGGDLVSQVPEWRGARDWLPGCRRAIAPRLGWTLEPQALKRLRQLGALPEVLNLRIPASASSGVRASPTPDQVPAELLPLLRRHDPYGLLSPRCASPSPSSTS